VIRCCIICEAQLSLNIPLLCLSSADTDQRGTPSSSWWQNSCCTALFLPWTEKVKYSLILKKTQATNNKKQCKNIATLSSSFITAALLVVAPSGNRKNAHFMVYKSVEYKVLTLLNKNLNVNSVIKTEALCRIRWRSLSLNLTVYILL
jgi:hypothetical protein